MVPGAQERISKKVAKWKGVTTTPHRFGGTEFKIGRREIGHIHGDYQADIAFPKTIRDQLIAEKKRNRITFCLGVGGSLFGLENAVDLFKLSYDLAGKRTTS